MTSQKISDLLRQLIDFFVICRKVHLHRDWKLFGFPDAQMPTDSDPATDQQLQDWLEKRHAECLSACRILATRRNVSPGVDEASSVAELVARHEALGNLPVRTVRQVA
ncbi:hypothetical protein EXS71_03545 [Candidatus Uhrbacteria bacterium]|nr:hypothetical protein [Candidatus Uhrbacteria bacterium]